MSSYHHFKGTNLSRSEHIQRLVFERAINSKIPNSERESSVTWECKHSSSCIQVGRILALKRGLDIELAEIISALHDIYVIDTGKYENHAVLGAEIARTILEDTKKFNNDEIDLICKSIAHHSEKQIYTDDPYVELIKDADIYDCSLYEGTIGYYKEHKPSDIYQEYMNRARTVSDELGVPVHPDFVN